MTYRRIDMINRFGRALPLSALFVVTALAGAACSSSSSSSPVSSGSSSKPAASSAAVNLSSVTLNVGDQKGTGAEAVLKAAGLLSSLPFKVSWSDFASGPPMLQAMGSGSVDIGGVGDAPPVFAAAGGEQVAIVSARDTPANASALVVPKGSSITSISQLRGKKIAVAEGSSADYHLLTVLTKAGLTPKDVTLDYLQPAEALAAFTSGHVDAWDIWSPYIEEAATTYNAKIVVNGNGFGGPYAFEVASRSALSDPGKAAAIKVYLTTLNKAYVWADSHVSTWASLWAQATGLSNTIMLKAAQDDTQTPIAITPAVISSEQGLVNAFYAAGLIPTKVNFANFSVTTFNATASG
jgi:sulfonate transport system substrate-binding protein